MEDALETTESNGTLQTILSAPRNKGVYLGVVLAAVISLAAVIAIEFLLGRPTRGHPWTPGAIAALHLYQALSVIATGYWVAFILTAKRILTVTPVRVEIKTTVLGQPISRRSFENCQIKNLRYGHWQIQARDKTMIDSSGIQFEAGGKTQNFGQKFTESQSINFISEMQRYYPFRPFSSQAISTNTDQ